MMDMHLIQDDCSRWVVTLASHNVCYFYRLDFFSFKGEWFLGTHHSSTRHFLPAITASTLQLDVTKVDVTGHHSHSISSTTVSSLELEVHPLDPHLLLYEIPFV